MFSIEKNDIKIQKELIILAILVITPIIDIIYSITYFVYSINIPIHLIMRTTVLIYMLISLREPRHIKYIVVLSLGLGCGIVWVKFMGYPFGFIDNAAYSMKLVNLFAAAFCFKEAVDNKQLTLEKLMNYINISTLVIGTTVVLSNIFRFGFRTYLDKPISGYKGFFIVHNSITAVLLMVIPISIYLFYKNKGKVNLVILVFNILAVSLIGTKSGTLGMVMIALMVIVQVMIYKKLYIKLKFINKKKAILTTMIVIILLGLVLYPFGSKFIKEQVRQFNDIGYDRLYSYIVSNRDLQIKYVDSEIKKNLNLNPKYFFGMGVKYANDVVHQGKKEFEIIEMDFEGVKIYSGYLVLILILSLIIKILIELILSIRNKKEFMVKSTVLMSLIMGLIHSIFGGHVIYEGISGIYFGSSLALAMCLSKDVNIIDAIKKKNKDM